MDNFQIQTVEQEFTSLQDLVTKVDAQIQDDLTYELCRDAIGQAKQISDKWCALYEDIRAAQKTALDVTYATINKVKNPCADIVKNLTFKCSEWDRRERERLREIERKANEEAKRQAEESTLREAQHHVNMGDTAKAEQVLATPVPVAPVIVVSRAQQAPVGNTSSRASWEAEVYDLAALIKAVADKTPGVPTTVLEANMSVLNGLAKSMGAELNIPGVRAKEKFSYAKTGRSK